VGTIFTNAVLRQESGAAISEEEIKRGLRVYLPQVGDTIEDIELKRELREEATRRVATVGGRALTTQQRLDLDELALETRKKKIKPITQTKETGGLAFPIHVP
jgi:allophanate hydrolase subunit 2